jgi:outer membrane biosynthesis protein TonB
VRAGLAISGVAHVVLLTWSTLVFPSAEVFEVEPVQSLPVEIITPSELTRILAGAEDAEPPEPETAPVAASEPDPQPQQTAALQPDTQPAPEAEPAPVAAAEPEPEPVAEPTPPEPQRVEINRNAMRVPTFRPRPPRHTEPNQQQFDADRIAALLDKAPDQEQTRRQNDSQSEQPATRGQSDGRDSNMSISEIDLLRRQISRCWNPPIGVQGAENLIVAIRISLRRDGTLSGTPEVDGAISGVTERVAAESALRAVRRCAPYQLPPEKYDTWRDIRVTFDPRLMLGG